MRLLRPPTSLLNPCMASQHVALLLLLLQPALLLIDFGHFQYNAVMLGTVSQNLLLRAHLTAS